MFMMALIVLLVVFIGLLVVTVLRDNKQKMAARGGGGSIFNWQQNRRRGSSNHHSPTASRQPEKKSEIKENNPQEDWLGPARKVSPRTVAQSPAEDADEVLGLKTRQPNTPAAESLTPFSQSASVKLTTESLPKLSPFIIFLKAKKESPYGGYELLQALLANHFRFGDMNLFHRHERTTGEGKKLFSLAAASKAGTFDLSKMGSFTCCGLSLFLSLSDQANPLVAFDLMLETAQQLVEDLGGTILDEQQQPLTIKKIQHWREDIRGWIRAKNNSASVVSMTTG